MAHRFILLCAIVGSVLLAGCDVLYGISSEKTVPGPPPDDQCIIAALQGTPGVLGVRKIIVGPDGWPIDDKEPVDEIPIKHFHYRIIDDFGPTLTIEKYREGNKYRVSHSMQNLNEPIPPEHINLALPIMHSVEQRITRECGLHIDSGMNRFCRPDCLLGTK
ncbi:MAG: hypothetical protein KF895_09530 [Parvibaculum sp.]|nr:hypothetical protein [Parvibaculum sp.]